QEPPAGCRAVVPPLLISPLFRGVQDYGSPLPATVVGRRHPRGARRDGRRWHTSISRNEPGRRSAAKLLMRDKARIAVNVARPGDSSCRCSNIISLRHRVHHPVARGHDQRRLALLVHAAEPARVKKRLTPLSVTDAVGLAYLHRHAAARAGVTLAGNHNRLLSLSLSF